MKHWSGPQWVLATYWLIFTIIPFVVRPLIVSCGGTPKSSRAEFFGRQASLFVSRVTLVAILTWGGFF